MTLANGASAWEPTLNLFGVLCLYSVLALDASELGGGTGPSESGVLGAEEGKEGERNAWRTPGPAHPEPGGTIRSLHPQPCFVFSRPSCSTIKLGRARTSLARVG